MIKLLKEGGIELTANGYRYPPDTDHPLMETVNESADLRGRIKGFNGLNDFLEKVLAASQRNSVVAKKKTDRKPAGT